MKSAVLILLLLCATGCFAQNCASSALGTKTLYAAPVLEQTAPPAGFTPLLINHIGRHGARHLTKMPSMSLAYKLLEKADSLGQLTLQGKSLKAMIEKLDQVEAGHVELISAAGATEQQGIAARMASANAALFNSKNLQVRVNVAKKKRTLQTAEAFLVSLPTLRSLTPSTLPVNDTILRFYDLSPAYVKFEEEGNWKNDWMALKDQLSLKEMDRSFLAKLFQPAYLNTLDAQSAESMTEEVFGFAQIVPSISVEMKAKELNAADLNFFSFFNCTQLKALAAVADAEDFYTKGPGTDAAGIQVKIAAPLLVDFIQSTDKAIQTHMPSVLLRFGHAETVAPFAALLNLHAASEPSRAGHEPVWQTSNVIPLSANIQWVVYENAAHTEQLVKLLLNEHETAINGLKPVRFPYYRWLDVRAFYMEKLNAMGANLSGNGYEFLLRVK